MAFCINCGKQLPEGAKFCLECGTPVASIPSPAPVPEPVSEPVVETPAPVPEPEPVVETPAPAPEPVAAEPAPQPQEEKKYTGYPPNYVPPTPQPEAAPVQNAAPQPQAAPAGKPPKPPKAPKATKPPKAPKQPSEGGIGFGTIMMIIAGALIVLALAVAVLGFILKAVGIGSSSKKAEGTGTALTQLLDDAAMTHYNGQGSSGPSSSDDEDKKEDEKEAESSETEETSDSGNSGEVLAQGYIHMTVPAGFELDSGEKEMRSTDNNRCMISIGYKRKTGDIDSARAAAEDDVNFYVSNGKDAADYYITDDITAGGYTWVVEHFPWDGEDHSAKFFTDIDDNYIFEVDSLLLNETDDVIIDFLGSLHFEDGDFGDLRSKWLESKQ